MTKQKRLLGLLALMALVIGIRWIDPLGAQPSPGAAASAAVERHAPNQTRQESTSAQPSEVRTPLTWPLREEVKDESGKTEAFANRIQYLASQFKPPVYTPPPAPVAVAPPTPVTPPEPPPALKVIGTWGAEPNLSVFLEGPQGTLQAKSGEVLLGEFVVQSITKQQVVLVNQRTQKVWPLSIPDAPSVLTTWPSR